MSSESSVANNGVRIQNEFSVEDQHQNQEISANVIKVPQFHEDLETWMKQLEISFNYSKIKSEKSKFQHLAMALPTSIARRYAHLLETDSESQYSDLKTAMLQDYDRKNPVTLQSLLSDTHLGDRSPSEAMQDLHSKLRKYGNGKVSFILLKDLFFRLLPESIQNALILQSEEDPFKLARMADLLVDKKRTMFNLQVIKEHSHLENEELSAISNKSSYKIAANQANSELLCYYHRTFGANARKCQAPCNWTRQNRPSRNVNEPPKNGNRFQ